MTHVSRDGGGSDANAKVADTEVKGTESLSPSGFKIHTPISTSMSKPADSPGTLFGLLTKALNDANRFAAALRQLGFTVKFETDYKSEYRWVATEVTGPLQLVDEPEAVVPRAAQMAEDASGMSEKTS